MVWYYLLYNIDDGELERAQSFEKDHKLAKDGKTNIRQWIRFMIMAMCIGLFCNNLRTQPFINLLTFLTNWCVWAELFASLFSFILAAFPSLTHKKATSLHALYHLFYTINLFLTPIVVFVYWSLIFKKHKGEMWESTKVFWGVP